MAKTSYLYGDIYLEHKTGSFHPESTERLVSINKAIYSSGLKEKLHFVEPVKSDIDVVLLNHDENYIKKVEQACLTNQRFIDSKDTEICSDSYKAAVYAVGGLIYTGDLIIDGKVVNAFCAVRPPGHHAEYNKAMGFCLFNNVAILAKYLIKNYNIERIAIIDWDVHHGNGTQNAFYSTDKVFYISLHQYPHYPGTGAESEIGKGNGKGYTLNFPMNAGNGDDEYISIFKNEIYSALSDYKPEFIIISAGFDAYYLDPLSNINITEDGYVTMTNVLLDITNKYSNDRLISVLEGGYNLAGLSSCISAHIQELLNV